MLCKKCGNLFPQKIKIKGVLKTLCNRKYCLECSPYGKHNTRQIEKTQQIKKGCVFIRICPECNKEYNSKYGLICATCSNKKQRQKKYDKIKSVVGNSCWICNYDKCWKAIHFHHVIPDYKKFDLCEANRYCWDLVLDEMKKCVVLCNRCHVEFHENLIDVKIIEQVWKDRWKEILGR